VLVLYGLPRDLVSSILAHEAMHVWLKLNQGFPFRMAPRLEEGLCQVIAYLYLQRIAACAEEGMVCMEGGAFRQFAQEQALRAYFQKQIQTDTSTVYGDGFREIYGAVQALGLQIVLEYIQQHLAVPPIG